MLLMVSPGDRKGCYTLKPYFKKELKGKKVPLKGADKHLATSLEGD